MPILVCEACVAVREYLHARRKDRRREARATRRQQGPQAPPQDP